MQIINLTILKIKITIFITLMQRFAIVMGITKLNCYFNTIITIFYFINANLETL
jgi:hypothetical protein